MRGQVSVKAKDEARLDSGYESEGWEFESPRARHFSQQKRCFYNTERLRRACPGPIVRVLGKPSPKVESGMKSKAYCFACEKRVSAPTILDKEGLWEALDSGADIEVRSSPDCARTRRFVTTARPSSVVQVPVSLIYSLTESDTRLLREPCPHTSWSGLQIHCKREGPHEVRRAERIQRESSSLRARSSPDRGVAAGYTGAKPASSLAWALPRLYSTRRSSDK